MINNDSLNGEAVDEECFLDEIYEFANNEKEPIQIRRQECERCRRPSTVCWCPFLPKERVKIATTVYVLQHPFEELRKLKTAPMLSQSLEVGNCHIIRGKRFGAKKRYVKYPDLQEVLKRSDTLLLFPGDDAVNIEELPPSPTPYNLVVLDGTWTQAKGMYANNNLLKLPRKVMINCDMRSRYVIRTQPTDNSLSTLESVAVALSVLEQRPQLVDLLTAPLDALCRFQLDYGAVKHQSKEYKIKYGLWKKTLPRKMIKRMQEEKNSRPQNDLGDCYHAKDLDLLGARDLEDTGDENLCNYSNQPLNGMKHIVVSDGAKMEISCDNNFCNNVIDDKIPIISQCNGTNNIQRFCNGHSLVTNCVNGENQGFSEQDIDKNLCHRQQPNGGAQMLENANKDCLCNGQRNLDENIDIDLDATKR